MSGVLSSRINASQQTRTSRSPHRSPTLHEACDNRGPPSEIDLEVINEVVLGTRERSWHRHQMLTLSGKGDPRGLSVSPSSINQTAGYFDVTLEPRFPSIHSMVALRAPTARLVTRL